MWWGRLPWSRRFNWRCWTQWGRFNMCTDKDWSIEGKGWVVGPLQVTLWPRNDWRKFCYTPEEAAEADRRER
jgi:hypothetical protein